MLFGVPDMFGITSRTSSLTTASEGDVDHPSYLGKGRFSLLWPKCRNSSNLPWREEHSPGRTEQRIAPERLYEMTENASHAV